MGDLSIFTQMMDLFAKGVGVLGSIYCVLGVLSIGRGRHEHGCQPNCQRRHLRSGGLGAQIHHARIGEPLCLVIMNLYCNKSFPS